MKLKKDEIINYDREKLVKAIERRKIKTIKFNKENQDDTDYRKIFYNTLKTTRESNEKTGLRVADKIIRGIQTQQQRRICYTKL